MFTQHYNPLITVFLFPFNFCHMPCHHKPNPTHNASNCNIAACTLRTHTHTHTVQYVATAEAANDHNSLQIAAANASHEPHSEALSGARRATLHRVKRKGIGSFFGARSKATPNTWDNNALPGQTPNYGGSSQNYGGSHSSPEESLYYLIVAAISFGVVVYCCYQCNSHSRGDGLDAYRARHLESARQRHQRLQQQNAGDSSLFNGVLNGQSLGEIDQFKATAPPLTPMVQTSEADRYRTTTTTTTTTNDTINRPTDYANGGLYPSDQPPSYEQAIQFDAARKQPHQQL